jgi:hypothetical protein
MFHAKRGKINLWVQKLEKILSMHTKNIQKMLKIAQLMLMTMAARDLLQDIRTVIPLKA